MNWEVILLIVIVLLSIGNVAGLLAWAIRINASLQKQTVAIETLSRSVALLAQRLGAVEGQVGNTTYYMTYGSTAYKLVADVAGHVGREGVISMQRPLIAGRPEHVGLKVRITAWLNDGESFTNGL